MLGMVGIQVDVQYYGNGVKCRYDLYYCMSIMWRKLVVLWVGFIGIGIEEKYED